MITKTYTLLLVTIGLLLNVMGTPETREIGAPAGNSTVAVVQSRVLIDCWPTTSGAKIDLDRDGIVDRCEQTLAEKFAPVIHHFEHERNYPTNVDWFLRRTQLWFYDDECDLFEGGDLHRLIEDRPTQLQLLGRSFSNGCGATYRVFSDGTRSEDKERTFYLKDVPDGDKIGSRETSEWTTYFHAYRNDKRGVTVQYWRFYAADSGKDKIVGIFGGHGGDWEGIHVVLDDCLRPVQVNYMGHTGIELRAWSDVNKDGNHPLVGSEIGGHASESFVPLPPIPPFPVRYTRQQTWTGGRVLWFDGRNTPAGTLLNLGEKMRPLNGQHYIRYSGIWGTPGFLYATSGYWNPAYNETEKGADNFIKAWCIGRAPDVPNEECYPQATIN